MSRGKSVRCWPGAIECYVGSGEELPFGWVVGSAPGPAFVTSGSWARSRSSVRSEAVRFHASSPRLGSALGPRPRCDAAPDPLRFRRIRRDLRRILLIETGGEFYLPGLRACVIDVQHLNSSSEEGLAVSIAHEAVHARLFNAGIPYRAELRDRIEQACVEQSALFAEKLPRGSALAAETRQALDTRWWTANELHARRVAHYRVAGVPEWALRIYRRLSGP